MQSILGQWGYSSLILACWDVSPLSEVLPGHCYRGRPRLPVVIRSAVDGRGANCLFLDDVQQVCRVSPCMIQQAIYYTCTMLSADSSRPYGSLHTCDVKETNYGISEENGRMVAKAINMDHSWFGPMVASRTFALKIFNRSCESDCDRSYGVCHIKCSLETGRCSDQILSQVISAAANRFAPSMCGSS